jgi:hypothetical protein
VTTRALTVLVVLLLFAGGHGAAQAPQNPRPDDAAVGALLDRIRDAVRSNSPDRYLSLLSANADVERARSFASLEFGSGVTNAVIVERERTLSSQGGFYRMIVDAFIESGNEGRLTTWQIDLARLDGDVRIANQEYLTSIEGLYRLALNRSRQLRAKNFKITSEDFELVLADGVVFTIDIDRGPTGLVLMGRGEMLFRPAPEIEKAQVKIFSGSETLATRFDAAYLRFGDISQHADLSTLTTEPVNESSFRQASRVFVEESAKSYVLDLSELTPDRWSGSPGVDDFVAEVRTRRYQTLTYSFAASEPEEVSLFNRAFGRNISIYSSQATRESRGPFYHEDDNAGYDVLDYDIDLVFSPERTWIDAVAKMRFQIRSTPRGQLRLTLADELTVHSIVSERFGRLFGLRAAGQNAVLVDLPATLMPATDDTLTIDYSGPLTPQPVEQEAILQGQKPDIPSDVAFPLAEPSFLYSNRTYWYPQPPVSDYATATIRITVPAPFACVASGTPAEDSPVTVGAATATAPRQYTFRAVQPLRYLSFVVSRFTEIDTNNGVVVHANPRQASRGRGIAAQGAQIAAFYESVVGDTPYPSLALALIEHNLPGGHSPAYFAIIDIPIPGTSLSWRGDPVAFENFPEFFLAHEIAHQWWGQAVGWGNYHEQWLSEGFAQYFAALYAERQRGADGFASVMRTMRRWSAERSDDGPVYLGYRVGHILNDGRSFRAIVYNKGAIVLHMLRQLLGDEAFFAGLREYYSAWRFRKAGTEDFRMVMEKHAKRPLGQFFEQWIYGSSLPRLRFSYRVERSASASDVVLHFDQVGPLFDVPVTVTLQYSDRRTADVVVPVTDRSVDLRVPLDGELRSAVISRDDASLARISR